MLLNGTLDAYIDGELSPEEAAEIRALLEGRPDWNAYVEDAFAIREAFPSWEDTEVPQGFAESVISALPERRRRPRRWMRWAMPLAACLCLAALVQGSGLLRPKGGSGSAPETALTAAPREAPEEHMEESAVEQPMPEEFMEVQSAASADGGGVRPEPSRETVQSTEDWNEFSAAGGGASARKTVPSRGAGAQTPAASEGLPRESAGAVESENGGAENGTYDMADDNAYDDYEGGIMETEETEEEEDPEEDPALSTDAAWEAGVPWEQEVDLVLPPEAAYLLSAWKETEILPSGTLYILTDWEYSELLDELWGADLGAYADESLLSRERVAVFVWLDRD